jgi:hypothetical protein
VEAEAAMVHECEVVTVVPSFAFGHAPIVTRRPARAYDVRNGVAKGMILRRSPPTTS